MLKSRGILFDIENLSIDGTSFSEDDDLNRHLLIGENLFAYVKNIKPKIVDGYEVSSEAAQIWKGKRNQISCTEKPDKKKTPIPLPSEASHVNICGSVVDIESPGLGYLVITSSDGGLNRIAFNTEEPVLVVGDTAGTIHSLKLSPNLRKKTKEIIRAAQNGSEREVRFSF